MLFTLPLAAIGLLIAQQQSPEAAARPPAAAAAAAAAQLSGTWSLDTARIPADERPQAVTIAFSELPDARWHTEVSIRTAGGVALHAESTAALDGVAVPVTGTMANIDAVSLRRPSPGTLVMTLGKDGQRVSTRVYTVAADGRTMTETIVWPAQAMPRMETTYFTRAS